MTFEEKMMLLASMKPGKEKQELLNKFTYGDKEFASRFYVDAVTLDQYMQANMERFKPVADRAAEIRKTMKNKGWSDKKYEKYLGELPEDLVKDRPEFSPYLPKKQRELLGLGILAGTYQ